MAKLHTDTPEARELHLFATHDAQLYRSRITPIIDSLKKKIKKGTYDKVLALKLWKYAADDAAKRYNKEFGGPSAGYGIFTVPIRNEVATLLQEYYDEELHYGENPVPLSSVARKKYINKNSQITKKPPTARLKKRRAKNSEVGYFPNPIKVTKSREKSNFPYSVETRQTENWSISKVFDNKKNAMDYAEELSIKYPRLPIRLVNYVGGKIADSGYFPNPINDPAKGALELEIVRAIKAAQTPTKLANKTDNMLTAQARLSYAQGLIQASEILGVFSKAETKFFLMQLKPDGVIGK